MAHTMMVDVKIIETLIEIVDYAIVRLAGSNDLGAANYLQEQLSSIKSKVENERFGRGDTTCVQIDTLIKMLGGEDG